MGQNTVTIVFWKILWTKIFCHSQCVKVQPVFTRDASTKCVNVQPVFTRDASTKCIKLCSGGICWWHRLVSQAEVGWMALMSLGMYSMQQTTPRKKVGPRSLVAKCLCRMTITAVTCIFSTMNTQTWIRIINCHRFSVCELRYIHPIKILAILVIKMYW